MQHRIGEKYGKLTIISRMPDHTFLCGQRKVSVKVICDCGASKEVLYSNLRKGVTKSCGCTHRNPMWQDKAAVKKWMSDYYLKNQDVLLSKSISYGEKHSAERRQYSKRRYASNVNKFREQNRVWQMANKEKKAATDKKYREENKEKIANYRHNYGPSYERKRRKYDIKFKLRMNVGCLIRSRLKQRLANKGKKSISSYLPYSIDELKIHLENKFQPGMNWKNYGKWHIDHKIPDSFFNYSSTKDLSFKKCWALNNLQPMWAKDNLQKGKKLHT